MISDLILQQLDLLQRHAGLVFVVLFLAMAMEGVVFTTLLMSGTVVLLAAGAAIAAGSLSYTPTFIALVLGLWAGDTASYWLGRRAKPWLMRQSFVARRADAMAKGEAMVARHGWLAIFVTRFMGPVRPFVTLAAGACNMGAVAFHVTTLVSTAIVTAALLQAGMTGLSVAGFSR